MQSFLTPPTPLFPFTVLFWTLENFLNKKWSSCRNSFRKPPCLIYSPKLKTLEFENENNQKNWSKCWILYATQCIYYLRISFEKFFVCSFVPLNLVITRYPACLVYPGLHRPRPLDHYHCLCNASHSQLFHQDKPRWLPCHVKCKQKTQTNQKIN